MNVDRVEAAFWAAYLRNRNVERASSSDGALAVAGGYALCAAGSFLEYAVGAGSRRPLTAQDLRNVADFYARRGLPARLELDQAVLARDRPVIEDAGLREDGLTMAVLETAAPAGEAGGPAQVARTADRGRWAALVVQACAGTVPAGDQERLAHAIQLCAASAHGLFLAWIDGVPVGGGAVAVSDDVAWLYAAGVLPDHRRRGVHRALLAARVRFGFERGASRAALKAQADSACEQSAVRQGFQRSRLRRRVRAAS